MSERIPAQVFPPGVFIMDEIEARGWTLDNVHSRLDNDPVACCAVDLAIFVHDKDLILDATTAGHLSRVFDFSPEYFINLDRAWRGVAAHLNRQPSDDLGLPSDTQGERA